MQMWLYTRSDQDPRVEMKAGLVMILTSTHPRLALTPAKAEELGQQLIESAGHARHAASKADAV